MRLLNLKLIIIALCFFTSAYAQQWRIFNTGNSLLPSNTVASIIIDKNNIKWIGTINGLVRIEGNNWQIFDTNNTPCGTNAIYPSALDSSNNLWCILNDKGIAKYNGANWIIYDSVNSGLPNYNNAGISIDFNNIKWISSPGLIKFDDITWTLYNTTNSGLPSNTVTSVAIEQHNKWVGMFLGAGGIAKFNDTNWTVYNTGNSGLPSDRIRQIKIDLLGNKWIATYAGGLAKFNSSVNSWTIYDPSNSGIPSYFVFRIAFRNSYQKIIGLEAEGISIYNDTTWINFNTSNSPLPSNAINDIKIDKFNNIWISTLAGLAIYNPDVIIGINNMQSEIPNNFKLHQNYPNPFNPVTRIEYELRKNAHIKIVVFDITGRILKTLFDAFQIAGSYNIKFDATDFTSGIYFYRLTVDTYSETKKMILIK